jgi:hypothetical protein
MTDDFEWQTDEEENEVWPGASPRPPASRSRRKVLAAALLLLFVTGVAVFWLYRQGQARVAGVTAALEADVLALHDLVQQASARRDLELFRPLISGRDAAWAEAQDELVARGYFSDRAFWGLVTDDTSPFAFLDREAGETAATTVNLAADLQIAEVRYEQRYHLTLPGDEATDVTLQQIALYGSAGSGDFWLLTPPGKEFWGEQHTFRGDHLKVVFHERDRELAQRLAPDLDAFLDELCHRLPDLVCPADLDVTLVLQGRPEALLNAARPVPDYDGARATSAFSMTLPTPTLVGLPLDEAGYRALLYGYTLNLAAATVAFLVDYTCCEGALFFEALLHYQLSRLELRLWPVDGTVYRRLVEETPPLENLIALWRPPDEDALARERGWHIYALIDFLLESLPGATATALQKQLASSHSYLEWLVSLVDGRSDLTGDLFVVRSLDQRLRYHAYLQSLAGDRELPPAPLPEQDLMLLCYDPFPGPDVDAPAGALYRLDVNRPALALEKTAGHLPWLSRLPDYSAFLLRQVDEALQLTQVTLHQDGQTALLYSGQFVHTFGQTDPAARHAVLYSFAPEPATRINLLPVEPSGCDGGCDPTPLPGLPTWSPDGSQTLLLSPAAGVARLPALYWHYDRLVALHDADALARLYRGDSRGQGVAGESRSREVGLGYAPFWLNNEAYGYVRLSSRGGPGVMLMATPPHIEQEVVLASVHDDEPQLLFSLADLMPYLPFRVRQERPLFIRYVVANPANGDEFVVSLFDAGSMEGYLFSFDRGTGELSHLLTLHHNAGQSAGFTPDGRWLVITGNSQADLVSAGVATTLYLFDWQEQAMEPIYIRRAGHYPSSLAYDWSSDGRWLAALAGSDYVLLMAPEDGHRRLIRHNAGECVSLIWQNREGDG